METNIQNSFDFIKNELKRLKNSSRTKDRVEFIKIMKTLLGFLINWNTMREQEEIKRLIKEYKEIIDNYNLYFYLKKDNNGQEQQTLESMPEENLTSDFKEDGEIIVEDIQF